MQRMEGKSDGAHFLKVKCSGRDNCGKGGERGADAELERGLTLSAKKRAAEMRMHAAKATKVEEAVLPTPRRGLDAGLTGPVGRDGCEEAVTLLDTSRGDRRGKSLLRIFVHLSVESVSLGKVRGCHHVNHQRRFIQGGLEIVRRHLARIISGLPQEEATRF